jgi:hypothetical protein
MVLAALLVQSMEFDNDVQVFLDTLTTENRDRVVQSFESKDRLNWRFVPGDRAGADARDMSDREEKAGAALLKKVLSSTGVKRANDIRDLEAVLRSLENNSWRDTQRYWHTVFGQPGSDKWGYRYEGHHLSLNFTFKGGEMVSSSPQFYGTNPSKPGGPLFFLNLTGHLVLESLTDAQKSEAIVSGRAPADILTAGKPVPKLEAEGLLVSEMSEPAQKLIASLIDLFDKDLNKAESARRAKNRGGLRFVWIGGTEQGQGHYYRIQGPNVVIEYDNTQNGANHIHAVYRDPSNDFGNDPLAEHYHDHPH